MKTRHADVFFEPGGVARAPGGPRHFWRRLLWSLVFPRRGQRVRLTTSGTVLIALALAVGLAAYNSGNNILFITLSLLLACLLLSGLTSWLNPSPVRWRWRVEPPLRAGLAHPVSLEVRNDKRVLPAYALWFELRSTSATRAERLEMPVRLDPGMSAMLDWTVRPAKRGVEQLRLEAVGSLFPFGFLRKTFPVELTKDVIVWPAAVEYRRFSAALWERARPGRPLSRAGSGADLHAIRRYERGDSHRSIHWKATARLRRTMVTQRAADGEDGYGLWLRTPAEIWTRPEQFELLCGFAATLAEDFFRAGRLTAVIINDEAPMPVRRLADIEAFLDRIALLTPVPSEEKRIRARHRLAGIYGKNLLTFAPEGARGVAAYVDGEKAASA